MRHPAIFCKDRSYRSGDMADFRFSRWRPSAILDFQKLEIKLPVWFGGPICVIVPNFAKISRTVPEICPFSIFQDSGRPPSWICFTHVGTTHEEYLVVFVTVQNLVVIGAVISIVCKF